MEEKGARKDIIDMYNNWSRSSLKILINKIKLL